MIDITSTLSGKGSQLNADDLSVEGQIIRITGARMTGGEQPLTLNYEGDLGRPFLPCLTMRRVLAHIWGKDAEAYVGRSLLVYRDPEVVWAGRKVGGVRIKGASHIDAPVSYTATVSKGKKQKVTIEPIKGATNPPAQAKKTANSPDRQSMEAWARHLISGVSAAPTHGAVEKIMGEKPVTQGRAKLRQVAPDLDENISAAINEKLSSFESEASPSPADDGPPDWAVEEVPA